MVSTLENIPPLGLEEGTIPEDRWDASDEEQLWRYIFSLDADETGVSDEEASLEDEEWLRTVLVEEEDAEENNPYRLEEQARLEAEILAEVQEEADATNPVLQWMHATTFVSQSNGRGRKPKRYPREVWLVQYNGDSAAGHWRSWGGEDQYHFHPISGLARLPWDGWVTEIYGREFCQGLSSRGTHPDDHLRQEIRRLVHQHKGRF